MSSIFPPPRLNCISRLNYSERDRTGRYSCCRGTAFKRSSCKDIHIFESGFHLQPSFPLLFLSLAASLRVWSLSISIQILLTSSWTKQITFQKVCGLTRSSFLWWDKGDNIGGEQVKRKEERELCFFFLPWTFSSRRFGDTEGRSGARSGRKGARKGWTRGRPGERENKRAHRIHHWVNYPHKPENISTHRSTQAYTDCVSPDCVRLQPTILSSEDGILLPQEETGLSVEKPGPPTDQLTPVSVPVLPSPPSAANELERPTPELEVLALLLRFVQEKRIWYRFVVRHDL